MIDSTFHLFGFYINIYIMMKRIRIGIQEAKFALSDKNRLDAFCLLLKIKLLFRSSDLNLVSYNHCAKLLHIDNNKLKRLLEYGCKIGYFRFEEKNGKKRFIARSIHSNYGYSYKLRKDDLTKMTFPALKNLLRRIVMENQVRMQEDVINTHNKGTNGRNAKTIRKALKRESRMLRKKFSDNKGLSYDRIKDVIYGTMYQAFKVTNQLVNKGIINKRTRIKEVRCDAKVCTVNGAADCKKALLLMKVGRLPEDFIEGMACEGGCVGGPSAFNDQISSKKNRDALISNADGRGIHENLKNYDMDSFSMHRE